MFTIEQTFSKAKYNDMMRNLEIEQKRQEYLDNAMPSKPASRPMSVAWNLFLGLLALIAAPYVR